MAKPQSCQSAKETAEAPPITMRAMNRDEIKEECHNLPAMRVMRINKRVKYAERVSVREQNR